MHRIDPDDLPATFGVVDCFLLNGEGEADGLILQDGTEVHLPPLGGSDLPAAVSIAPEEGAPIADAGPPDDDEGRKASRRRAHEGRTDMEARGVTRQLRHGAKGEVRGVPHRAQDIAAMMVPDMTVLLRGEGLATPHGTAIAVREIGTAASDLRPVENKKPRKDHKEHKPHRPAPRGRNSGDTAPL